MFLVCPLAHRLAVVASQPSQYAATVDQPLSQTGVDLNQHVTRTCLVLHAKTVVEVAGALFQLSFLNTHAYVAV
jgi:hypothetical protein